MDKQEQNLPFEFRDRPVSPEKKAANWNAVLTAIQKRRIFRLTAIAASTILVIGLGVMLFLNNKSNVQTIARENNIKLTDSTLAIVHHEVNTTGKDKRVQLSDGSLIVLANNSEVTWLEPFTNKRDITLIGKAYFKVAKDEAKPFTVISEDISTTALGTQFTVTTFKNSKRIIIRLYEGKVVVKSVLKENWRLLNDVYLLPGQEFIYSIYATSKVQNFKLREGDVSEQKISRELEQEDPLIPQNTARSWYMFNNELLENVLDLLAEMHQVQIIYDRKDVQNIYFTGKYNSADSIETILKQIGTLNNLTISNKDNAFIISK